MSIGKHASKKILISRDERDFNPIQNSILKPNRYRGKDIGESEKMS
jgi:hypothetical protein